LNSTQTEFGIIISANCIQNSNNIYIIKYKYNKIKIQMFNIVVADKPFD